MSLLLADGLTKDYGSFRALDSLNLTLAPGEIVGLLGPNGSGKSTAIRTILGFLKPTAGRVSVAGFDCWRESVEVRRRVAYLPGELRLYDNFTGRRLVHFLAALRGESLTERLDQLADQLDINLDKPLTQMSSGMKRKVALLAVLLPRVPLIILDEPTNTLDPTMRDELLEQLKIAKSQGQAVLFSSHVLQEVEAVCDRVIVLRKGRLVHEQCMAELRGGRHISAKLLSSPPSAGPEGCAIEVVADRVRFDYCGPLQVLLAWLAQLPHDDLRIEPLGLSPIYNKFHSGRLA
jgi:ABC-2 type transport system ATP-binding protein